MNRIDNRYDHLGWVETHLRHENSDLPALRLTAQSHYNSEGFAFIDVYGVDQDTPRRRSIRTAAQDLLERLGHRVVLEHGRDVYSITPDRPTSNHEALIVLALLQRHLASGTMIETDVQAN